MEAVTLRNEYLFLTRISEKAERFEDMTNYIHKLAQEDAQFDEEERDLLAIAYKNVVGPNRIAWKAVTKMEIIEENGKRHTHYLQIVREYKKKVENDILRACDEILNVISQSLLPSAVKDVEALIFYYKLKGDYNRYIAEVTLEDKYEKAISSAESSYKTGWDMANEHLENTSLLKLGIALNFAVFYFEVLDEPIKAIKQAKKMLTMAKNDLDLLKSEKYKQSFMIYKLLEDNITQWQGELDLERESTSSKGEEVSKKSINTKGLEQSKRSVNTKKIDLSKRSINTKKIDLSKRSIKTKGNQELEVTKENQESEVTKQKQDFNFKDN